MSIKSNLIAASAALAFCAVPAIAQDVSQEPYNGTITLSSGFDPDPNATEVLAGGGNSVEGLGAGCFGLVSTAPDLRVNYTAGQYPLSFAAIPAEDGKDTTLVINAPDGSWHCNDDGASGTLDPVVRFDNPASGQYDIWVGIYSEGDFIPTTLFVTERELTDK